ncbi:MAG: cytochrome c biogenesis protein CcdA [Candidatus Eisenbacteria bacterium]
MMRRSPAGRFASCLLALVVSMPLVWVGRARAQGAEPPPAETLIRVHAARAHVTAGSAVEVPIGLTIRGGWHVNANPPASEEMIPTTVEIVAAPGFTTGATRYPPGERRKLSFADEELLVYDGAVTARVPVTVAPGVATGAHTLAGRLRFQACNDELCLAPVTVPFEVVLEVTAGVPVTPGPGAATGGTAIPAPSPAGADSGFVTAPPAGAGTSSGPGGAMIDNPIARLFARGSFLAFLSLFLIGLALNLTPCVYPMLGVTVGIFGARRGASPLRAFGLASVYVLGMATMYSALGVAAALTGTLFGAWMQSPWVLFAFSAMMVVLALSMFGVYELNPPYWLMSRLGGGGATGAMGIFLSGLAVGVIAAPCTGPPVLALLALVGAKADPVFGFMAFFVLALGLGAPYLLLGTFSNMLQRLPRSGMWMEYVKKGFGTMMLLIGVYFATLALKPDALLTVVTVGAIVGTIYLAFFERSVPYAWFRRVQWVAGVLGILVAVMLLLTMARTSERRHQLAFEPYSPAALEQAAAAGRPVMLDFSADWCLPCHELELKTFTDPVVVTRAQRFRRLRVDLTHYDSDESHRARERFEVRGVPTVVFIGADGREVRASRVERFLTPERFLERMNAALAATGTASR